MKPHQPETVTPRERHYGVLRRNCLETEPAWGVYVEGSGPADVLGYFFTEEGARSYARWRNEHRGEPGE